MGKVKASVAAAAKAKKAFMKINNKIYDPNDGDLAKVRAENRKLSRAELAKEAAMSADDHAKQVANGDAQRHAALSMRSKTAIEYAHKAKHAAQTLSKAAAQASLEASQLAEKA